MIVNDIKLKGITTNRILGNYLVKNGIPLLQERNGKMVFSKTNRLAEVLEDLPLSLKIFGKVDE